MKNISTAVRGHYDDDGYMRAIIIRRFCDIQAPRSRPWGERRGSGGRSGGRSRCVHAGRDEVDEGRTCVCSSDKAQL
jgi:hypothetical protein